VTIGQFVKNLIVSVQFSSVTSLCMCFSYVSSLLQVFYVYNFESQRVWCPFLLTLGLCLCISVLWCQVTNDIAEQCCLFWWIDWHFFVFLFVLVWSSVGIQNVLFYKVKLVLFWVIGLIYFCFSKALVAPQEAWCTRCWRRRWLCEVVGQQQSQRVCGGATSLQPSSSTDRLLRPTDDFCCCCRCWATDHGHSCCCCWCTGCHRCRIYRLDDPLADCHYRCTCINWTLICRLSLASSHFRSRTLQ